MKNKIIAVFLFAFVTISAQALENDKTMETKKLRLDEAVATALENNTSIKQNQIKFKQTERTYKHSWNNFLPSLNASATATESNGITSSDSEVRTISTGISASISISAGLGKKIQAAKADYESGLLDYEDCINSIKVDVTKSFYSLLYLDKQVELNRESLASYEEQYKQTEIKKSRGLVSEVDLLTSQLNYETAKVTLRNAESNYLNSLFEYLNDIGYEVEENTMIVLDGSLDDVEDYAAFSIEEGKLEELIDNTPSVRTVKDSINKSKLSLSQTKLDTYLPSVSLSANVNPYSTTNTIKNDSWNVSLGFTFKLDNLIPGSSTSDNIKTQEENITSLELQLADTKKQLMTSAIEMINAIDIAKETLKNCEQNAELAKKSYELATVAYKNGTKDLSSLQTIQNSYSNALVQLNNQQLNLITTVINLKSLLGLF